MNTSGSLASQIRRVLRDSTRPLSTREIADAVDTPTDTTYLRTVVGDLVRRNELLRHHDPAGLTYSLRQPCRRAVVAQPRPPRAGSTQERVLALLAGKQLTCTQLAEASRGSMSPQRIGYALQEMRKGGRVTGDRHRPVLWESVAAPPLSLTPPAQVAQTSLRALIEAAQHELDSAAELLVRARHALLDDDELPPCVGERMRDAALDIARNGAED